MRRFNLIRGFCPAKKTESRFISVRETFINSVVPGQTTSLTRTGSRISSDDGVTATEENRRGIHTIIRPNFTIPELHDDSQRKPQPLFTMGNTTTSFNLQWTKTFCTNAEISYKDIFMQKGIDFVIFCDGSFKEDVPGYTPPLDAKPAGAATGWALFERGVLIAAMGEMCDADTSNKAEVLAIKRAIGALIERKIKQAIIVSDSLSSIQALQGVTKDPSGSEKEFQSIRGLLRRYHKKYSCVYVPRDLNSVGHHMAEIGHKSEFDGDVIVNPSERLIEILGKMKLDFNFPK